jgi:hypothetical protein
LYQYIATNICLINQFSHGKTKEGEKKCTMPESVLSLNDIVYEEEEKINF